MRRPNILLLITDQQRWDALGANGNPDIQTPHLDRLAAEGVNFDHCFAQNPVCMPSRASLLTGQYPGTLGITHMGVPVPPETVTLPRLVRNASYTSANIVKLHFLPHANRDHRTPHPDYGFDQLEIADEPGPYDDAYRAWVRRVAPDQLDLISLGLPPTAETWQRTMGLIDPIAHSDERFPLAALPFHGRAEVTHTAFVAEQTRAFIEPRRATPWLCIAGFYSPHSPWVAPQEYLDRYDPNTFDLPTFPRSSRRGVARSSWARRTTRSRALPPQTTSCGRRDTAIMRWSARSIIMSGRSWRSLRRRGRPRTPSSSSRPIMASGWASICATAKAIRATTR